VLEKLQTYSLNLTCFLSTPSVLETLLGKGSPSYNHELMQLLLRHDLNEAKKEETVRQKEEEQDVEYKRQLALARPDALTRTPSNSMMSDTYSSTSAVTSGRLHEESLTDLHSKHTALLLTAVEQVNYSIDIADTQLLLLKSWKMFVQLCLLKQPAVLGLSQKSPLAWKYVNTLVRLLQTQFNSNSIQFKLNSIQFNSTLV